MNSDKYDDPVIEEQWCNEQRLHVIEYIKEQKIECGEIGEWPAWHVAPYVAIWAIESKKKPSWIGWWVISGDLPIDYISAAMVKHPRDAMRQFVKNWAEVSDYMLRGESHPSITIGKPSDWPLLGDLLKRRSELLAKFSEDNSIWVE